MSVRFGAGRSEPRVVRAQMRVERRQMPTLHPRLAEQALTLASYQHCPTSGEVVSRRSNAVSP